ncbi:MULTISPECIES: succinate dehydrogenase/fumarate reductase cytochrome b subunit [Prevotella]|uniref:succinate dehydrogenase/fumarate reductase cytochrome b subunit n=1 Tax=Prevotella TaxID=838 RepID=UPI000E57463E|nr:MULTISPECIES: succinate dehydrogenase/fumarate reductase cytochrome b subunit [Prevotella]AXV49197.1 succinate dehydrogenase/fumarate reductase cytochrome b subunit [Prevotella denticola]QUB70466.1 succinate dehydrogenase/fumarate reductase cytochrome b subunit [Prevotella multiformis]
MWLINSSIGRKVIMSVTGMALILFMTFHCCMNLVALFSGKAYNMICELLGANWYAVVATVALGALAVCHIVYAFILTAQNRRARGDNRYAVTEKPASVEWASQNMLVLGIIVLLGIGLHLFNFWYNMMFAELTGMAVKIPPSHGFEYIQATFANPVYVVLYIIWLAALWFHLSHGFWSAMQTVGINGKVWFSRWKTIGVVYVTLLMLCFLVVVLAFAFHCAPSLCCAAA